MKQQEKKENTDMLSLNADLKSKAIRKVYLLYGGEAYLRIQYRRSLQAAVTAPDDTMNAASFSGKGCDPRQIIELADTVPFFAERRFIWVDDSGLFNRACDELEAYLPTMPESTCLVFTETKADGKNRLFKLVKKLGLTVNCTPTSDWLSKWVARKFNGKKIRSSTVQLILDSVGPDMENISQEVDKLLSYCMDREEITPEDVKTICRAKISSRIYDVVNALLDGDLNRATSLFYEQLDAGESPRDILGSLTSQFNLLLSTHSMLSMGYDRYRIASRLSISPGRAWHCVDQARHFSEDALTRRIKDCTQTAEDINSGRLDEFMAVEMLLVRCCGHA